MNWISFSRALTVSSRHLKGLELFPEILLCFSSVPTLTDDKTIHQLGRNIFAIPALSCYQILVSTQKQVIEFAKAGEDVMSFRAAMNEVDFPVVQRPGNFFNRIWEVAAFLQVHNVWI